jgi:hypothetical protein
VRITVKINQIAKIFREVNFVKFLPASGLTIFNI